MILDLLMTIVLGGFGLLLGVLHLMRALYGAGICDEPDVSPEFDECGARLTERVAAEHAPP